MGASCDYCNHRCCVNGEFGVGIVCECEGCGKVMYLCSNDLTEKELQERCNGEACGCGDNTENILCEECLKNQ